MHFKFPLFIQKNVEIVTFYSIAESQTFFTRVTYIYHCIFYIVKHIYSFFLIGHGTVIQNFEHYISFKNNMSLNFNVKFIF